MTTAADPDILQNIYLRGACAPVQEEVTARNLAVIGQIPPVRNDRLGPTSGIALAWVPIPTLLALPVALGPWWKLAAHQLN
jgi:hypothetical protein